MRLTLLVVISEASLLPACISTPAMPAPASTGATSKPISNRAGAEPGPLPVIPGGAGFAMHTPAGSGRHVLNSTVDHAARAAVVSHWTFDDDVPADASLQGDAAMVGRDGGQALQLGGKGSLILANTGSTLASGGSFTIMAWVYFDATGGTVARSVAEAGDYWELGSTDSFGGKWLFRIDSGDEANGHATSSVLVAPGKWRHVAGVYDGETGTFRLYLNGNRMHNGWNKSVPLGDAAKATDLVIGRGIDGAMDDVMHLNEALTDEQVRSFFASQHDSYFDTPAEIYRVTNLNDSGPGSLRHGIESQERARTIVVEVSGTIELESPISLGPQNSYLTVAGATAPSPGITLKSYGLRIGSGCHDLLLQHLRIRTGDTSIVGKLPGPWTDVDGDGPGTVYSHPLETEPQTHYGGGTKRSVWWNEDNLSHDPGKTTQVGINKWDWDPGNENENANANANAKRSPDGVLYINVGEDPASGRVEYGFSKSSVADPLTMTPGTRMIVVDHLTTTWGGDMNMQTQGTYITIQNCLIAEALHHPRHPKGGHSRGLLVFAYGPDQARFVDVVANLFAYNMARNPTVAKGHMVLVANNLVSDVNVGIKCFTSDSKSYKNTHLMLSVKKNVVRRSNYPLLARLVTGTPAESKIYFSPDNSVDGKTFDSVEQIWAEAVTNPFKTGDVPEIARANTSPVDVPGLTLKPIDEVETWVLANAGARPADRDSADTRIVHNVQKGKGRLPIASQDEVGSWPELAENHRTFPVPGDPFGDADGDGYTNLEQRLHRFAAEVEGRNR